MNQHRRKIAFVSQHCLVDFTNGAATATLDTLVFLQSLGFHCEAFCNSRLDSWEEVLIEEVLAERGLPYTVRDADQGNSVWSGVSVRRTPQPSTVSVPRTPLRRALNPTDLIHRLARERFRGNSGYLADRSDKGSGRRAVL